jgi:membrane protease YdiL (CAAX protease family)
VVWGLWHAPLIALDGYEYGVRSWAVAPLFCLFTVPTAVIMAWLRFRSGCVWPTVIMHAAINAEASTVLLAVTAAPSMLIGAPIGLIGVGPYWVAATWVIVTGRLTPPAEERAG